MLLRQLSLANFRSYSNLDLELNPGLTTITGENGQGKSNLLEAIYFLAIGKSYRASVEKDLIYWHADFTDAYLIIAADPEVFSNIWGEGVKVIGPWSGQLSDRGERIRIKDALGEGVDDVSYSDQGDWAFRRAEDSEQILNGESCLLYTSPSPRDS